MVTRIKAYKNDPNGLGRGPGVYYHRGKGYYSKYKIERDRNKLSTGWKTDKVGIPKGTKFPHVTDGMINDYWYKHPQWFGRKPRKTK